MDINKKKIKIQLNNLKKLFVILLKFKKSYLIFLLFSTMAISIFPYISLLLSQKLINTLQIGYSSLNDVILILIFYFVINISSLSLGNLKAFVLKKYTDYLYYQLNVYFRKKCTYLSYKDFENERIYNTLQRAEQQIGIRPIQVVNDILSIISSILNLLLALVILTIWHKWVILGFIILPVVSFKYFLKINYFEYNNITERAETERKSWYLTHLLIKDYFIKEIKMLNISDYLLEKYNAILHKIFKDNTSINLKKSIFNHIYQILNTIFTSIVVFISFVEAYSGKILIGNFMTNISTTSKIENAISGSVSSFFSLYNDLLFCSHIFDFLEIANTRKKNIQVYKESIDHIEKIALKNVSYKYSTNKNYTLKNINIEFNAGDVVALIGENGSGKTTLIKILTGLYEDYEGEIFVNDINFKNFNINEIRTKMGVIFQDYNKYEFNVKENIGLGDVSNIDNIEKIKYAAVQANINELIESLPYGYNQQLGNWFKNGIQLSGGQWQKIALARTLIRKSDVYILDEPTAALDPYAEYLFFKNVKEIIKNNMCIFVTHRYVNTIIANKIIYLKDGHVKESGNHTELMNYNGEYAKLYKLQVGENK